MKKKGTPRMKENNMTASGVATPDAYKKLVK